MEIFIDWGLCFDAMRLELVEQLKIRCPAHDGALRNSISAAVEDGRLNIWMLNYAMYVEEGCFFGNTHRTRVLTKRGYKQLKDVKVGDEVLTHNNKWRKVIEKPIYPVNRKIPRYTIITESGKKVTVTEEHPFRVKTENGYIWKKAKELTTKDIIQEVD